MNSSKVIFAVVATVIVISPMVLLRLIISDRIDSCSAQDGMLMSLTIFGF
jgi:hypothetical protein